MIPINFELFTLLYLLTGGLSIFALWVYYERRDRAMYQAQREEKTFHCVRCGTLYSEQQKKVAPCPACGFENTVLKF